MHLQKQWWCLNNPHHTCCVERLNHSMFHEKTEFSCLFIYLYFVTRRKNDDKSILSEFKGRLGKRYLDFFLCPTV